MLKVHGVHGSPFVRKVLIALELKGLEYEMVVQMPFTGDEEYKKLNPLGKIPTLVDGDLTLGDSKERWFGSVGANDALPMLCQSSAIKIV